VTLSISVKRLALKFLSNSVVCFALLLAAASFSCQAQSRQAVIVYAAEMPLVIEHSGGDYAELATVLNTERGKPLPVFFLFGGDSLGPSTLSSFDRGVHVIDVLNRLEPDAMAVAKREFSFYEDELSQRSYEASFPVLASNIYDPVTKGNLDGLESAVLLKKNQVSIGVIAVLSPTAVEQYPLKRITITDPRPAIVQHAAALRQAGAELVVLMYSADFDFIEPLLESSVIDLALRKNELSHLSNKSEQKLHPHHIYLKEEDQIVRVDLAWDRQKPASLVVKPELISLTAQKSDPQIQSLVQKHSGRLEQLLSEPIGQTSVELDTRRDQIRGFENVFANYIADTLREHTGAQIGLMNGGNIRGETVYQAGTVLTRRTIALELPYRDSAVLLKLTGAQLLQALENGFSQYEMRRGRFPQVSGMTVVFDSNKAPGQRVVSVKVNGKELQADQSYSLATVEYLAGGGDGYTVLTQATRLNYAGQMSKTLNDLVVDRIKKQHSLNGIIEQRLVNLAQSAED
jgi:2',3'-cyclic-nucleotide 2'-phosphodiesterase (5'-nucleotidase family)